MWRKQDEPKPASQEVKVSPAVEPIASTPVSVPAPIPVPVATSNISASPRQATAPAGHLTTSIVIKGEITGREDLFIDGEVHGKIRLDDGRVTIGPNGRVVADVQAREIVVRGKVKGNLHGRDRVQVGPTGSATGDLVARLISIEEGAEIHGKVEILRPEESRLAHNDEDSAEAGEIQVPVALQARQSNNGL